MDVRAVLGPARVRDVTRGKLALLPDYLGSGSPADVRSVLGFIRSGVRPGAPDKSGDCFLLLEEVAAGMPEQGLRVLEATLEAESVSGLERRLTFLGWACGLAARLAGAAGAEATSGGPLGGLIFEAKQFQEDVAEVIAEKEVLLWHAVRAAAGRGPAGSGDAGSRLAPAWQAAGRLLHVASRVVSRLPDAARREYGPLVARGLEIYGSVSKPV